MDRLEPSKKEFRNLTELFDWMREMGVEEGSPLWHKNYALFLSMKARKMDVPQFGVFELTPRCNLDCKMCYVHLSPTQMDGRKEVSGDQITNIMDQAMELGLMDVQLTGGEAMLHPDFERIFLHCISKGLRVSVLTNGLLLTDEKIKFFKENPPAALQITLYGWDDDSYEKVTGFRVYRKISENILKAKDLNCRLTISITPSKYCRKEEVEKIIQFCQENELQCRVNNDLQMPYKETERNVEDFDLTEDQFIEIRHVMVKAEPVDESSLPKEGKDTQEYYGTKCAAGRGMFCMTWDGILKPCLDMTIGADPIKDGFPAAWEEINSQAKAYRIPSECNDCAYASICNQCPALHSKGAARGHADRRVCARTKRMVVEGLLKLPQERNQ